MPNLTQDEAEKEYMRNDGCPYCRSKLEYGDLEIIDGEVFRDVFCSSEKCGAEFQETWVLHAVSAYHAPKGT